MFPISSSCSKSANVTDIVEEHFRSLDVTDIAKLANVLGGIRRMPMNFSVAVINVVGSQIVKRQHAAPCHLPGHVVFGGSAPQFTLRCLNVCFRCGFGALRPRIDGRHSLAARARTRVKGERVARDEGRTM